MKADGLGATMRVHSAEIVLVVVILVWAVACARPIPYEPNASLDRESAAAAVERALFSQLPEFRPEYVEMKEDYLAYGQGVVSRGSSSTIAGPIGGGAVSGSYGRSTSKLMTERIYFDSITNIRLYARRRRFVVKVFLAPGEPAVHYYFFTADQGKRMVDALQTLRMHWVATHSK